MPVGVWLLWGDEWIPLRQARRALETWAEVGRPRPRHDYRGAAQQLVERLGRPDATPAAERALVEALVEALADSARAKRFHPDVLSPLLEVVVGPADPSAQLDGPRMTRLLALNFEARRAFTKPAIRRSAGRGRYICMGELGTRTSSPASPPTRASAPSTPVRIWTASSTMPAATCSD